MKKIIVDKHKINDAFSYYIIVEAGVNYNTKIKITEKLIIQAKQNNSDAIKFQIKRISNKEEIVGDLINFSSEASTYVIGSNLLVEGGWTAW